MLPNVASITCQTRKRCADKIHTAAVANNLRPCKNMCSTYTSFYSVHKGLSAQQEPHKAVLLRSGVSPLTPQDLGGSTAPHITALTPQVKADCVDNNNSSTKGDNSSRYPQQQSPAPLQAAPCSADKCSTLTALVCATQQHWVAASLQGMMRAVCSRLCNLAPCLQGW